MKLVAKDGRNVSQKTEASVQNQTVAPTRSRGTANRRGQAVKRQNKSNRRRHGKSSTQIAKWHQQLSFLVETLEHSLRTVENFRATLEKYDPEACGVLVSRKHFFDLDLTEDEF